MVCLIGDSEFEDLSRTLSMFHLYLEEAQRSGDAGAYLGGCVLLASALEAALLAMVQCFPDEVRTVADERHPRELSRPASEWSLSQLLLIAKELGWLPAAQSPESLRRPVGSAIGDYAEVVRAIRNLVHPAIYLRECPGETINERHLDVSFRILEAACSCLADALERATRESQGCQSQDAPIP